MLSKISQGLKVHLYIINGGREWIRKGQGSGNERELVVERGGIDIKQYYEKDLCGNKIDLCSNKNIKTNLIATEKIFHQ